MKNLCALLLASLSPNLIHADPEASPTPAPSTPPSATQPAPAAPASPPPGLSASPEAVRSAILKAAGSGRVERVRAVRRGDRTLYLADIDLAGDYDLKLQVLATGEVARRTEEMAMETLPEAVRKIMKSLAGATGLIDEVKKITEHGSTYFKAEIDREGKPELDVKISPDGTLLEQKEEAD